MMWAVRVAAGGQHAGRPAMNAILCLVFILGVAQAVLSVIGVIEEAMALLSG